MPSPSDRSLTRRTAMGAALALGGALVSGCSDRIHLGGTDTPTAAPPTPLRADVTLAARVVTEIAGSIALLEATLTRYPALGARVRPLLNAERTQHDFLLRSIPAAARPAPTTGTSSGTPAASAGDALAGAGRSVAGTRAALTRAALEAESGELARVLASMAAGLAQFLTQFQPQLPAAGKQAKADR